MIYRMLKSFIYSCFGSVIYIINATFYNSGDMACTFSVVRDRTKIPHTGT